MIIKDGVVTTAQLVPLGMNGGGTYKAYMNMAGKSRKLINVIVHAVVGLPSDQYHIGIRSDLKSSHSTRL